MGTQVSRRVVLIQANRFLQALEKHAHAPHVKPRLAQNIETLAIRLALEIPGKGQLGRNRPGLRRRNRRPGHLPARTSGQQSQRHRHHRRHTDLLRLEHLARNVALRHVREFMPEHAGQLRLRLRRDDQPGMHPDIPAGHGKGVDIRIIDREKVKTETGVVAHRRQPSTQLIQISFDIGIIEIRRLAPANFMHDLLADFLLGTQRQIVAGSVPQLRQFVGCHGRQSQRAGKKDGDQALAQVHGAMIPQPPNCPSGAS